ncbi:MepB family protein [Nocardioides sp. InS609-2]|uniref:MepB family protein n=1 Tax=Nocardioides sp. InS609-2 TaxID=2760705 RepID=UPI0020C0D623|nr:MepB family protein [Nocardioides sp. InS609-2]
MESEPDNVDYGAVVSVTGETRFRVGKLTPRKVGLFVTVWRRAADGSTEPLSAGDGARSLVITVREGDGFGLFVFPKSALVEHGIVSVDGVGGKRGFRVYPPWSSTANSQAKRSQWWQCEFFLDLNGGEIDAERARRLFEAV